jgi:hypothetical protein
VLLLADPIPSSAASMESVRAPGRLAKTGVEQPTTALVAGAHASTGSRPWACALLSLSRPPPPSARGQMQWSYFSSWWLGRRARKLLASTHVWSHGGLLPVVAMEASLRPRRDTAWCGHGRGNEEEKAEARTSF